MNARLRHALAPRFASNFSRPSPPPLPPHQQREFEELFRQAQQAPPSTNLTDPASTLHPDAPQPVQPEFAGDINPVTGENGGPKREPVRKWNEGDWSFKGKVSDF